jgi:rod shape-determining protein MreC
MTSRRSRLFAAAVLGGQLVLLTAQAPDPAGPAGDARSLLSGLALRAVAPFARAVAFVGEGFAGFGRGLRGRSALARENEELRAELLELRRERLRWAGLEREAGELAGALAFARASGLELRAAPVVHLDRASWLRTLLVRVGARGARPDQVVLAESGVVGRVIESAGPWARVQLLTDRAAAAGALLETARRQGIVRGAGPDELDLEYVPRQAEVEVGDRVVTAGIDGVYPRGLPIGVVVAVEPGDERFHRIRVRPAVDLGELAMVYLIEGAPPPLPPAAPAPSGAASPPSPPPPPAGATP